MKLKARIARVEARLDDDVCPLCGTDLREKEVRERDLVEDELQRLIASGWTEEQACQVILEAIPQAAKYLPNAKEREAV